MPDEQKPTIPVFTAGGYRVLITVSNQEMPGGLANVTWRANGREVNIKLTDASTKREFKFRHIGALMWRPNGNTAFAISDNEFWEQANTLEARFGWSYKTEQHALTALAGYIQHCLIHGKQSFRKGIVFTPPA